jgi:hypothetical protein
LEGTCFSQPRSGTITQGRHDTELIDRVLLGRIARYKVRDTYFIAIQHSPR